MKINGEIFRISDKDGNVLFEVDVDGTISLLSTTVDGSGNWTIDQNITTPILISPRVIAGRLLADTANGDIFIQNNGGTNLAVFKDSGDIGIGTTTPSEKLEVVGNIGWEFGSGNVYMGIETTGGKDLITDAAQLKGSTGGSFLVRNTGDAANPQYSFAAPYNDAGMFRPVGVSALGFSTSGVERVKIDSSGDVGIGTSTPTAKLELNGGSETTILKLDGDTAANAVGFNQYNGYNTWRDLTTGTNIQLLFSGGVVNFPNNVGVGLSGIAQPSEKLEVNGNVKISGDMLKMSGITTTERNALTAVAGDIIYNTTDNKHQGYNGTIWNDLY